MDMSLSFEQRIHCYRLATAGLLVIASFAAMSLLPPSAPVSASRLTAEARLGYLVFECLLSAAVAIVAVRLKDSTVAAGANQTAATKSLDLFQVKTRWAAFRQMGSQLWPSDETTHRPMPAARNSPTLTSETRKPAVTRPAIKTSDNANLARRAEADFVKIRRHEPGPLSEPQKPGPKFSAGNASRDGREPLSDSETRLLFGALSRGTERHLGRGPQVRELAQLVRAINEGSCPDLLIPAALAGKLDVYWDGNAWAFEQANVNQVRDGSDPPQEELEEEDETDV
jgi:hypothetical protein